MHEMEKLEGWNSDSAVGLTINLAARIQGEAEPHSIVVDASVQRLLGAGFVMTSLGSRTLKGIGHRSSCGGSMPGPQSPHALTLPGTDTKGRWSAAPMSFGRFGVGGKRL